jgi:hypothetical protein
MCIYIYIHIKVHEIIYVLPAQGTLVLTVSCEGPLTQFMLRSKLHSEPYALTPHTALIICPLMRRRRVYSVKG